MIGQPLAKLLNNYHSPCKQQQNIKHQMLEFLSNADCFKRSCPIGHFTASALLLDHKQEHALLMHHRKLKQWVQLGGHCDGNNDILAVAIQEAMEESGIKNIIPVSSEILDLDLHLIPANDRENEHWHYDVRFLLKVNSNEQIHANHESLNLQWFTPKLSELPTNSPSVVRLFEKWITLWK